MNIVSFLPTFFNQIKNKNNIIRKMPNYNININHQRYFSNKYLNLMNQLNNIEIKNYKNESRLNILDPIILYYNDNKKMASSIIFISLLAIYFALKSLGK
jgi:hypothetical protein